MTKDKNRCANQILADMELFDFLKEKVGPVGKVCGRIRSPFPQESRIRVAG